MAGSGSIENDPLPVYRVQRFASESRAFAESPTRQILVWLGADRRHRDSDETATKRI